MRKTQTRASSFFISRPQLTVHVLVDLEDFLCQTYSYHIRVQKSSNNNKKFYQCLWYAITHKEVCNFVIADRNINNKP